MAEEVKVFGFWPSPFTHIVKLALKLKGVKYEYIQEELPNKSSLLLKYNPVHKKVPVLLYNGKPIAESLVILEFIDETWKVNPLLPKDPYDRAVARFWAHFIDAKLFPVTRDVIMGKTKEQKDIEEALELVKTLENELKGKKFFGGETIGFVDIAAGFLTLWVRVAQEVKGEELLTKEKFPKLFDWIDEFLGCSFVKESLPTRENMVGFFQAQFQASK